jgi:4-amino-4-deoxy-L-arabinose transferase-like glycosyltransferase
MILRANASFIFYSVKAFSFIFGHTTFIVRMFSAIIGSDSSIYLLGKEIYNKKVGLIAATFFGGKLFSYFLFSKQDHIFYSCLLF